MPPSNSKDLRARRTALKIPHKVMATGIGLSHVDLLSIEVDTLIDGYESELADFYAYWLNRLERLTKEQLQIQIKHAQEGRRFK
jgi:hypothetical protein